MEEHGLARRTDPDTSKAAAMAVKVNRLERVILIYLREYSQVGLTTSDIASMARIPRDSLSPRMKRLVQLQLIVDSGERRAPTIAHSDGRNHPKQIVWRATERGMGVSST